MAIGAVSRRYIGPFLCINLVMHAAVLALAGWSLNKYIDRETHRHLGGNSSTGYLLVFSLMAGVVGECSVLAGLVHVRAWRGESLAIAASTGLVSWALTALSFGCYAIALLGRTGSPCVQAYHSRKPRKAPEDIRGVHHDLDADAAALSDSAPRRHPEQRVWAELQESRRLTLQRNPS